MSFFLFFLPTVLFYPPLTLSCGVFSHLITLIYKCISFYLIAKALCKQCCKSFIQVYYFTRCLCLFRGIHTRNISLRLPAWCLLFMLCFTVWFKACCKANKEGKRWRKQSPHVTAQLLYRAWKGWTVMWSELAGCFWKYQFSNFKINTHAETLPFLISCSF